MRRQVHDFLDSIAHRRCPPHSQVARYQRPAKTWLLVATVRCGNRAGVAWNMLLRSSGPGRMVASSMRRWSGSAVHNGSLFRPGIQSSRQQVRGRGLSHDIVQPSATTALSGRWKVPRRQYKLQSLPSIALKIFLP